MTSFATAVRLLGAPQWRWLRMITVGLVAIVAAWSVATPPNGGVDEPDHVIRAAAAARLDFAGTGVVSPLGEAVRHYDVPLAFEGPSISCWARDSTISAACSTWPVGSSGRVGVLNSYYPPAYFVLTGWPSLFTSRYFIVRAMRLLSGVLSVGFVGVGLLAVKRAWGRQAAAVTVMALTPATLSLMGVINPQALEIGAAFCLWSTTAAVLGDDPPTRLQKWAFVASGAILCLTRPLGPFLTAAILVAVALTVGVRQSLAALKRLEVLIVVAVGLVTTVVLATHGVTSLDAPDLARHVTLGETVKQTLGNSLNDIRDSITLTGWLDTKLPGIATIFWMSGISVMLIGLVVARAYRALIALAFIAVAFLGIETYVLYTQANSNGLNWQGRYGLPIYIGLPFIVMARRPLLPPRTLQLLVGGFVAIQWVSLYWGLRRWTVGTNGPLLYVFREDWIPPIPSVVIL
ncbi:MAG: DUF2142 domain-containing protein, partial [Ilumatobacteraceae bacterium]